MKDFIDSIIPMYAGKLFENFWIDFLPKNINYESRKLMKIIAF